MRTIHKYTFPIDDAFTLDIPDGYQIIHVQSQPSWEEEREKPTLWALVNTDNPRVTVKFRLYGTGHVVESESRDHIATFFTNLGAGVWHLFWDGEEGYWRGNRGDDFHVGFVSA